MSEMRDVRSLSVTRRYGRGLGRGAAGALGALRGALFLFIFVGGGWFEVVVGVGVISVDDEPSMFVFCQIASLVVENLK